MSKGKATRGGTELPPPMKKMKKILEEMKSRADIVPFMEPVDWKGYKLLDYPQIIKQPMDLGTVTKRLLAGDYKTPQECADDIRLVWTNCMTYNQDGSDFHSLASKLSHVFEEKYSRAFKDSITGEDAGVEKGLPPTLAEKTQFSNSVYEISSEELGEIVRMLQERCPQALSKTTTPDGLEINIDDIDEKTFRELEKFVAMCLAGGKKSKKRSGDDGEPSSKKRKQKK